MEEKCRQARGFRSCLPGPGSNIQRGEAYEATQGDRARPSRGTAQDANDALAAYPVGDHHVGMLSWKQETAASYNVDIGERLLVQATDHFIAAAPVCETIAPSRMSS